jgi:hypothetical protein
LKIFEADLTRQSKIIDEQGALVQRLSSLLWEFQLTLIGPLYYGQSVFRREVAGVDDQDSATPTALKPYEDAAKNYLTNAGRLLGSIRAEIGGAMRLVPFDQ